MPADKAYTEHLIARDLQPTADIRIHRASGIMQMLVSVVQIVAALYTLYAAEGAQIARWGYAAYGLSVLPYALMSVMNILSASVVGEYASGHVLRTPVLREAARREGSHFDGAVGAVRKRAEPALGQHGRAGYVAVWMRTVVRDESRELVVRTRTWERRFTLCASDGAESDGAHRFTVSALRHDGAADDPEVAKHRAISPAEAAITGTLFLAAMLLPHALICALTRFRAGSSSAAQRAWMMAWLSADQLASLGTLVFWAVWKRWGAVIPVGVHYASVAALVVPAVGGFVVMSKMYLQDQGLGACGT